MLVPKDDNTSAGPRAGTLLSALRTGIRLTAGAAPFGLTYGHVIEE